MIRDLKGALIINLKNAISLRHPLKTINGFIQGTLVI